MVQHNDGIHIGHAEHRVDWTNRQADRHTVRQACHAHSAKCDSSSSGVRFPFPTCTAHTRIQLNRLVVVSRLTPVLKTGQRKASLGKPKRDGRE